MLRWSLVSYLLPLPVEALPTFPLPLEGCVAGGPAPDLLDLCTGEILLVLRLPALQVVGDASMDDSSPFLEMILVGVSVGHVIHLLRNEFDHIPILQDVTLETQLMMNWPGGQISKALV